MHRLRAVLARKARRASRPARRPPAAADPGSSKLILICGAGSSGKTYATERALAIGYDVTTDRADRFYRAAFQAAGIPREDGMYHIGREARKLRGGAYDAATVDRFWGTYQDFVRRHLRNAIDWGVTPVLEGFTLAYADEVERIVAVARELAGGDVEVFRVQLKPSLKDWNRNRGSKIRWGSGPVLSPAKRRAYEQSMEASAPEPVPGVEDRVVADSEGALERLVNDEVGLRPHRWYQRVSLGPVETKGPSEATEKSDAVLDRDVEGKRVLDVCCATGVISLLLKQRGAAGVVGVERDPRRYSKALELRNTLKRHSQLDADVGIRLGDALEVLPTLERFDTAVLFGALHYFPDYERTLALVANAATDAVYIEFNFADSGHDTAAAPDGIHPYARSRFGETIYLGNRDTIEEVVARAMPGFRIEERRPISPPGPRNRHQREVWRMRRSA
jgi:SAM-dependent methyltransferase